MEANAMESCKAVLIAGGTGFIAQALVNFLLKKNYQVVVLGRSRQKIQKCFGAAVTAATWSEFDSQYSELLSGIDAVINLCGANIGRKRWTAERKALLFSSRLDPTQKLVAAISQQSNPPALFNASGVGIYGLQDELSDHVFTEADSVPTRYADDFICDLAKRWEQAAWCATHQGVRVVLLRFGVVLGAGGGALKKLQRPYSFGLGGRVGSGQQPFAWVAIQDVVEAIFFLLEHDDIQGAVNLVSPDTIIQSEFAAALAAQLHRPMLFHMPRWLVRLIFGQMGMELLLSGQAVLPTVLCSSGFEFQKTGLKVALKRIIT
jgi:uncharacterized protein